MKFRRIQFMLFESAGVMNEAYFYLNNNYISKIFPKPRTYKLNKAHRTNKILYVDP